MEIQNLLRDISKRAGSAGSNQTLREACEVALVHLSSSANNTAVSTLITSTTSYAYPYSEVLKAFCLATQSTADRVLMAGLDGLGHIIATASLASLLDACFVISWDEALSEGGDGRQGKSNGGGKRGANGTKGLVGQGDLEEGRHGGKLGGNRLLAEGIDDGTLEGADNVSSSSILNTEVQLPYHLACVCHFIFTRRPYNETSTHLKVIQLLLGAAGKSLQLLPVGDVLIQKLFEPLLSLHAAHHALSTGGGVGMGGVPISGNMSGIAKYGIGGSSSASLSNSATLSKYSYQLLSVLVAEMTLGRFLADAFPLDWEFFEPFTCSAATVGTLEECAPDDLFESIHIPARCRPFSSEGVGGFSLRDSGNMTVNFPPSFGHFKEMLLMLCRLASSTVPIGLAEDAKGAGIARRGCCLRLLIDVFTALPIANANDEHRSASWLALALEPHQLLPCISKNLATRAFFGEALHLFALLCLKVHFHVGVELHGYLTNIVIPLALSQLSSFEHKVATIRCVRNAFLSNPRALISIFINHDCSPDTIDKRRGAAAMGFLSSVVPFLTTLMFTQFSLVSEDQTLLLRQECVEAMAAFVRSLLAWAAEEVPEVKYLDPKKAPLAYHWKHVHHLQHNKLLLQESRAVNIEGGMKKWLAFAAEHGFFVSLHPAVIAKFLHHECPQVVGDEVKHSLANALLKAPLHEEIMSELLALRSMRGQPLDIAFRDFVCDVLHPEGMPADKQLPESQAWGRLQTLFGAEYAKQNADADVKLTAYAADALAGSILFLHSATHNANSVMRFTASDWIEKTIESMGTTVARSYLEPIYLRTVAAPWGTLQTIMGGGGGGSKGSGGSAGKGGGGGSGTSGGGGGGSNNSNKQGHKQSSSSVRLGLSYVNDELTEGEHSGSNKSRFDGLYCSKARELCLEFHQQWLARLTYTFYRQPYIAPFYAMHVRPILLNYLPHVVVCLQLGALSLARMPTLTLISDCFGDVNELAGALALNLRDLREPAKRLADSLFARPNAVPPEPFTLATIPLLCLDL